MTAGQFKTLVFAVCIMVAAAAAGQWAGLRINSTPSLPMGIYIVASSEARLVEFCPPEPFARMSAERGYRSQGRCEDGRAPMLKPVVAKAGDRVELSAAGIRVNGALLPNTAPRTNDSRGRTLQPFPFGNYRVAPNTVWVASTYHPLSFDSRYIGPLPVALILDHVRPLLTL
jgi:conjugative transfer signal peptidase TraF